MIKTFHCNMLDENCYVVSDDATKECVIIDCGALYEEECDAIINYIESNALKPVHLLATHGHLDHNFGNAAIFARYGLRAEVNVADGQLLKEIDQQAMTFFGMKLSDPPAPLGTHINHGDKIVYGTQTLQAIHTPGHTNGCMVFYNAEEKVAFTGDTLFKMSVGRTDLIGGSYDSLITSLRNLADILPGETVIYTGHGPSSDMKTELQYNPYLR